MSMAAQIINYATGPRRRAMPFTVVHMTIWLSIVSFVFIFAGCFAIPDFDLIFRDFHTDLPLITKTVLALSRGCKDDFGWVALLLLPMAPIALDRLNGRHWATDGVPRRTRILFGLFMLLAVAAFLFVIYSVYLPMIPLGGGVSSPVPAPVAHG